MKGNELKPRIGLFGRRNAGKSSLVNYLTGQQIAIVSDTAGTTTDPVRKSMEIGGIGPVVLIDTAGIDDTGELGAQRVEKSLAALAEVDLALLLFTQWGEPEARVADWCATHHTPLLLLRTKSDLGIDGPLPDGAMPISTHDPALREPLLDAIRQALPTSAWRRPSLLSGVFDEGDTVVMVTPIDSSAPEGRMILPQVQVLRDLMDLHAVAVVCQPQQLQATLAAHPSPRLVVTDSQVFGPVATMVPTDVMLTSFSVVLARQKGPFDHYVTGTRTIAQLRDGDRVLLLESCTHNVTCEDIGRVKLPAALQRATGRKLRCEVVAGASPLPTPLDDYRLVIQCGGCVATERQLRSRLAPAIEAGVPVSNYGLALAWCNGIFDRALQPFAPTINPLQTQHTSCS